MSGSDSWVNLVSFGVFAATFCTILCNKRTLSSYYLIVGGWCTRWKFDCTGCIIHTVYISASPCVCLTGIFLTNIVKVESHLVFHLVDCHKASFKLYHRWFLHHTVSWHTSSNNCLLSKQKSFFFSFFYSLQVWIKISTQNTKLDFESITKNICSREIKIARLNVVDSIYLFVIISTKCKFW